MVCVSPRMENRGPYQLQACIHAEIRNEPSYIYIYMGETGTLFTPWVPGQLGVAFFLNLGFTIHRGSLKQFTSYHLMALMAH